MTIRIFFTILAVLAFLFGVGFILVPDQVIATYGIQPSPALALLGRLYGGSLLSLAAILWFARDFGDGAALRAVLIGAAIIGVVSLVVSVMSTLSGVQNAMGWSTVLIHLFVTAGSAYFLMGRSS